MFARAWSSTAEVAVMLAMAANAMAAMTAMAVMTMTTTAVFGAVTLDSVAVRLGLP